MRKIRFLEDDNDGVDDLNSNIDEEEREDDDKDRDNDDGNKSMVEIFAQTISSSLRMWVWVWVWVWVWEGGGGTIKQSHSCCCCHNNNMIHCADCVLFLLPWKCVAGTAGTSSGTNAYTLKYTCGSLMIPLAPLALTSCMYKYKQRIPYLSYGYESV